MNELGSVHQHSDTIPQQTAGRATWVPGRHSHMLSTNWVVVTQFVQCLPRVWWWAQFCLLNSGKRLAIRSFAHLPIASTTPRRDISISIVCHGYGHLMVVVVVVDGPVIRSNGCNRVWPTMACDLIA